MSVKLKGTIVRVVPYQCGRFEFVIVLQNVTGSPYDIEEQTVLCKEPPACVIGDHVAVEVEEEMLENNWQAICFEVVK